MDFNFSEIIKTKTDKELSDIYLHKERYQKEMYEEAKKELLNRNIDLGQLDEQIKERIQEQMIGIEEGKDGNVLYMFLCFVLSLLGGLLGIIAGYIYAYSTIDTPEGKYYRYNESTRKWGKVIFFTGIAVFCYAIFTRMNN